MCGGLSNLIKHGNFIWHIDREILKIGAKNVNHFEIVQPHTNEECSAINSNASVEKH